MKIAASFHNFKNVLCDEVTIGYRLGTIGLIIENVKKIKTLKNPGYYLVVQFPESGIFF